MRAADIQTDTAQPHTLPVQRLQIAGCSCSLFLPADYGDEKKYYPVLYVNGQMPIEEVLTEVRRAGIPMDFIVLSIEPENWNDDFTPWRAPSLRRGEEQPKGKAQAYLYRLVKEIKPYMDEAYRTKPEPEQTALFGYSLGGLTALYAVYLTDRFGWIGSLSGSLWYDGFCEFMEKTRPLRLDLHLYLSLGKKEKLSRNPRMGKVAECTQRAKDILEKQLHSAEGLEEPDHCGAGEICLEWNEGGHFHETAKRFAKAIVWWRKKAI